MLLVKIMDKMRSLELDWDKPSSICTKVSRGQGSGESEKVSKDVKKYKPKYFP